MSKPPSLAALLAQTDQRRCRVAVILDDLGPDDRDALTAALSEPSVSTFRIANALRQNGVIVAQDSVMKHRRGACNCAR